MKTKILNSALTPYQKLMMFLLFIVFFSLGLKFLLVNFSEIPVDEILDKKFVFMIYSYIIFFPLSLFFFLLLFVKDGILIKNNNLYKAFFLFSNPVFKQKKKLDNIMGTLHYFHTEKIIN